jgi:hypothetical protein
MLIITFDNFSQFDREKKRIEQYLSEMADIDEETAYAVKLAVIELAGNIIKHSGTRALMNMECEGDIIKILFKGGKCFNLKEICLPPSDFECGRGIYLVKEVCESLEYYDGGKEVCVSIRCRRKKY